MIAWASTDISTSTWVACTNVLFGLPSIEETSLALGNARAFNQPPTFIVSLTLILTLITSRDAISWFRSRLMYHSSISSSGACTCTFQSHPPKTYAFFGELHQAGLFWTSSSRLSAQLQSFGHGCSYRRYQIEPLPGTNIHKVVEPSHQILVDIVETDGIMRAAFASKFKVDRVVGVPPME